MDYNRIMDGYTARREDGLKRHDVNMRPVFGAHTITCRTPAHLRADLTKKKTSLVRAERLGNAAPVATTANGPTGLGPAGG